MGVIWDAVLLANTDPSDSDNDITKKVGSMSTLFQVANASLSSVVANVYIDTKRDFAELIDSHLPDIYARTPYSALSYIQWWQLFGFTYNQTDAIRELIRPLQIDGVEGAYTPTQITDAITAHKKITIETMTSTFVAMFIKNALVRTQTNFKASTNSGFKPFETDILYWTEESKNLWRDCKKRLWIDFFRTGEVTDVERLRIKKRTLSRG